MASSPSEKFSSPLLAFLLLWQCGLMPRDFSSSHPKVGLALGSGSARGWAHIGVIQSLKKAGIPVHCVAGASMGAFVGAVFCAGQIEALKEEVCRLDWRRMARMVDLSFPRSGLLEGEKIEAFIRRLVQDRSLEELSIPFWAVATHLHTGKEVWLRSGPTAIAVRASLSIPGIFTPVRQGSLWLVDGGLTNPVPVSVCRAMGADLVIAVNLNADILPHPPKRAERKKPLGRSQLGKAFWRYWQQHGNHLRKFVSLPRPSEQPSLSIFEVLLYSLHVMQDRITRQRLAVDPPDFHITPYLRHIQLLEFHRAEEAIAEGERATQALLPLIRESLAAEVPQEPERG